MTAYSVLELLDRWHAGDSGALYQLVRTEAGWLRSYVSRKMTSKMRRFETSEDLVQSVLVQLLRTTPRFRPANEKQFRALVAKVALNRLIDLHDYSVQDMRDPDMEHTQSSAVLNLGAATRTFESPTAAMENEENRAMAALALQLVDSETRRIIKLHLWGEKTFREIGRLLGLSEDAARQRYRRAIRTLQEQRRRLEGGELDDHVQELEGGLGADNKLP